MGASALQTAINPVGRIEDYLNKELKNGQVEKPTLEGGQRNEVNRQLAPMIQASIDRQRNAVMQDSGPLLAGIGPAVRQDVQNLSPFSNPFEADAATNADYIEDLNTMKDNTRKTITKSKFGGLKKKKKTNPAYTKLTNQILEAETQQKALEQGRLGADAQFQAYNNQAPSYRAAPIQAGLLQRMAGGSTGMNQIAAGQQNNPTLAKAKV